MAHLTVPQLIKLLIGIFVVVVVVLGIFLFFRGTAIDFFKNLIGVEEEGEFGGGGVSGEIDGEDSSVVLGDDMEDPLIRCEDCEEDNDCRRGECRAISNELNKLGEECIFVGTGSREEHQCITVEIDFCDECSRGVCTESECLRISEESTEFNCQYILRETLFGPNTCITVSSDQPTRICEDCWKEQPWSPICTENRCSDISDELAEFNMRCEFTNPGWFTKSECTTIDN